MAPSSSASLNCLTSPGQARALTQAGYDADIASDAMVRLLQVQLFSLLFEAEQLELNDIVRLTRTVVQLNRQRRTKEAGPQQKPAASRPAATTGRNMFTEQDSQEIRVSLGKAFAPTITPAAFGHPGRSAVPAGPANHTNSAEPAKPAAPVVRPAPPPLQAPHGMKVPSPLTEGPYPRLTANLRSTALTVQQHLEDVLASLPVSVACQYESGRRQ
jgi:hypothetical protein